MKNQNVEIIGAVGSLCASALTLLGVRQSAGSKGVKLLGDEREVSCRLESTFTTYPSDGKGTVRALGKTGTHDAPIVEQVEESVQMALEAVAYDAYRFDHWTRNGVQTYDQASFGYVFGRQDDNWIAYFVEEETVFDVYGSAYPQDAGSGMYWTIRITAVPEVPQSVQLTLSGYLRRPNGDIESFQGTIGVGENLVTSLRYTEGEDNVTIGGLDASTSTPGYRVGAVDYNASRMLSDSLEAGYSPWDLTADDDDRVPPVGDSEQ